MQRSVRTPACFAIFIGAVLATACSDGGGGPSREGSADSSCCALRRICDRCSCSDAERLAAALDDGPTCRAADHAGCLNLSAGAAASECAALDPSSAADGDCCSLSRLCEGCACPAVEEYAAALGKNSVCRQLAYGGCPARSTGEAAALCEAPTPSAGPSCCELQAICDGCACQDVEEATAILGDEEACRRTDHGGCLAFSRADASRECTTAPDDGPSCCELRQLCRGCSCSDRDRLAASVGGEDRCARTRHRGCIAFSRAEAQSACAAPSGPSCCAMRAICERCSCSDTQEFLGLQGAEAECQSVDHGGCLNLSRAAAEAGCPD